MHCLNRFDNGVYTLIQFLRAVSHSDDVDDVPTASGNVAPSAAVQPPDLCEVCLVEERFCASCAARVEEEAPGNSLSIKL